MNFNFKTIKIKLPKLPGVYFMKAKDGRVLYVGKAANLKRRVSSYFERPQDYRISRMIAEVRSMTWKITDTVIEALILEAEMIKKYQPFYNILAKDDKSFLYVVVPREKFPRVLVVRQNEAMSYDKPLGRFGPFTSGVSIRAAMKILRRIFPWSEHGEWNKEQGIKDKENKAIKPCFNYQIGLCPGVCVGVIIERDYKKIIRQLIRFLKGEKKSVLIDLKKEMKLLSKEQRFEEAAKIRGRVFALEHIHDVALIDKSNFGSGVSEDWGRVEGYDISNISGTSSVGSMVVFTKGEPNKNEYRKFKIKTISGSNDVGMMREVLERRFGHMEWMMPDLILIDGGLAQVNVARGVIGDLKLAIPVVGIAKGPERKRNDFIYPPELHRQILKNRDILIRVRDEAHRFAVKYHRELRGVGFRAKARGSPFRVRGSG